MRSTTLWTKVLAHTLSFALLAQTSIPAMAAAPPEDHLFFGPVSCVRRDGKETKVNFQVAVPKGLKAPFKLRITEEAPVTTKIKVNGQMAMTSAEFKPFGQVVKVISSSKAWIAWKCRWRARKGNGSPWNFWVRACERRPHRPRCRKLAFSLPPPGRGWAPQRMPRSHFKFRSGWSCVPP